jgi:CRP-like cAMP-binding protein
VANQPDNKERLFEKYGRKHSGGEIVFAEDDEAREVFMLAEGRVRLIKRVRHIERDIVVLKSGDIFGEAALLPGQRHPCSAVALGDCRILALPSGDFEELLRQQADITFKFIRQMIRRLQASEERIENMMLRDSQSKIVNTLIKLAQNSDTQEGHIFLTISPIELSSRIGLDVDSVKRGILKLKENRYLGISNEKIEIFNLEALRKLYRLIGMKEELKRG